MSNLKQALGLKDSESPFPWQENLLARFRAGIGNRLLLDIPTGLGKTSVMAAWLVARAEATPLPRRLVYVVDRRAVVDQATAEAEKLRQWVDDHPGIKLQLGLDTGQHLPISTLRGQYVDNREWLEDPTSPAIIVGTIDMIGSRLLFEGYGVSRKMRPYHAGLLGRDTLFVLDEAHLVPPFEMMLESLVTDADIFGPASELAAIVPDFKLLSLSATGRNVAGDVVNLSDKDLDHRVAKQRLDAVKRLAFFESDGSAPLAEVLAAQAWEMAEHGQSNVRVIVFSNRREDAEKAQKTIETIAKGDKKKGIPKIEIETELFVGARRVREREDAATWLKDRGFLAGADATPDHPTFVFATSAGEVGVDLDADHMVSDLVQWERMVQRLGRVNRRGDGDANVRVIIESPQPDKKTQDAIAKPESDRTKGEQKKVEEFVAATEQTDVFRRPLQALRMRQDNYDASPGAIRQLKLEAKTDERLERIICNATSRSPLRPALTRPVVDSWSMTSLEKHTGRPLIAPWLRGWIDEDPQTTVVWRRYLPVCEGTPFSDKKRKADATEFFEHAPPHLSETLETETFRVRDAITRRAKAILKSLDESKPSEGADGEESLTTESVVGIILGRALEVVAILKLKDLLFEGDDKKDNKLRKDRLERTLRENTLVLDRRFGGLSEKGLLDDGEKSPPAVADDEEPWIESGFRVSQSEDGTKATEPGWQTCFRFASHVSEDGEPTRFLVIDKRKNAVPSEGERSLSRTSQKLGVHLTWAENEAERIASRLGLSESYTKMLKIAARLHDAGKDCDRWQNAFSAPAEGRPFAKTVGPVKFSLLDGYRHEFGSLPALEADDEFQSLDPDLQALCLHLVAAHHGFARPTIRIQGCNDAPPSALEGRARDVALRFARLQQRWGPWGLAWWESLLRAADQRASRDIETQKTEANHG